MSVVGSAYLRLLRQDVLCLLRELLLGEHSAVAELSKPLELVEHRDEARMRPCSDMRRWARGYSGGVLGALALLLAAVCCR